MPVVQVPAPMAETRLPIPETSPPLAEAAPPVMIGEGRPSTPCGAEPATAVNGRDKPDHDDEDMDCARAIGTVLAVAFSHSISEPNVEAGYERVASLTDQPLSYDAFRDAIDACLRVGLIREPIRLPEGALQCHWRLELTHKGVAEIRRR